MTKRLPDSPIKSSFVCFPASVGIAHRDPNSWPVRRFLYFNACFLDNFYRIGIFRTISASKLSHVLKTGTQEILNFRWLVTVYYPMKRTDSPSHFGFHSGIGG